MVIRVSSLLCANKPVDDSEGEGELKYPIGGGVFSDISLGVLFVYSHWFFSD